MYMLKIIALISILLIFYLHSKNLYEGLDTSLSGGNYSDQSGKKRFDVPPLVPLNVISNNSNNSNNSVNNNSVTTNSNFIEEGFVSKQGRSCDNWRMLRFDVPPLVPGVNVNVAEVQQEIGEYKDMVKI